MVLAVIACGQLMVVLDVTIVNVALPSIGRALNVSAGDRQWVITAYTLAFAGLLLVGGRAADLLGRKRAFLIALAGFATASAAGGMAVNLQTLVAARAGQGVFGALLAPTALSLVAATFPDPRERGRAFGLFGVVMGGGAGVGLVLGGALTEYLSWRWVLYINTPLALAVGIAAALVLSESRSEDRPRVDAVGAALATAGLTALVYGFNAATVHGWTAPLTLSALGGGIVLLLAFLAAERRLDSPLLPLRIVMHRSRGGAYLAFMLVMIGMFGMFLLVSFYLQTVAGYTALRAGVAFLPFAGGTFIASTLIARVITRVRSGLLLAGGLLLAAGGMGWLTQLGIDSDYSIHVFPALLLIGLGLGVLSPVAANLATFEVPEQDSGVASGVFNTSEQIGASLGLGLLNTVAATSTAGYVAAARSGPDVRASGLVHGYTVAAAWAAVILAIGAVLVLALVNARLDGVPPGAHETGPAPAGVPMRRILHLFRPHRNKLLIVALLVGLSSVVSVASPFLLREVLDVAIPQGRVGQLSLLIGGMIAVAVGTSAVNVGQTYLSTQVGQSVMHDLRSAVYGRLQRMSLAFYTRTRTGEIQSRIANDIGTMQTTVTATATSLVSNLTTVLASVTAMVVLDWRLTVVSLLLLPIFIRVSRRVGAERERITATRQSHLAMMSADVQESLSVSGIMLGRTLGRADSLINTFTADSATLARLEVSSSMAGRWRMSSIQIVMTALPALIYFAAGISTATGIPTVTLGTLVAFVTLQQGLFRPTLSLLSTGVEVQASLALFRRIYEYLDLPIDITEPDRPVHVTHISGEVSFTEVEFSYDTAAPGKTLAGIDLIVPAGTSLAVVGETGSGKTTLSYLVPRLYDVTRGRVCIDGVDVRQLGFDTLAGAVGVVSQETYLLHASVADNLRIAKPDATDQELVEAAKAAQIHHHIAGLPDGYDTLVGERGYRFSGGEKQRLAIARTILRNPPILILDEATSALDTETEYAVAEALDTLSSSRTTITIAHRMSTIRGADQIVVLADGRIAEHGTHDELLAADGRYAALLRRDTDQLASAA